MQNMTQSSVHSELFKFIHHVSVRWDDSVVVEMHYVYHLKTNQVCAVEQLSALLLHSQRGSLPSSVAVGVVSCVLMCVGWCSILFAQLHSFIVMSHHYMPTIGPPPTGNACQKATACTVHGLLLLLSAGKHMRELFHAKKVPQTKIQYLWSKSAFIQ